MRLIPVLDRIIVRQLEAEEVTQGGIYLPDQAKEKPLKGRIESVGRQVKSVKPGQTIVFSKYAETFLLARSAQASPRPIEHTKFGEFLVLKESNVLAIVRE